MCYMMFKNACYQLLKLLGCDLAAIDVIKTWKQFGVLCLEFVFACIMLFLLWKMLLQCYDTIFQSSEVIAIFTILSFLIIGVILYFNFYDGDE